MNYHEYDIKEVFTSLKSIAKGLDPDEAASRLDANGRNELEQDPGTPL